MITNFKNFIPIIVHHCPATSQVLARHDGECYDVHYLALQTAPKADLGSGDEMIAAFNKNFTFYFSASPIGSTQKIFQLFQFF